MSVIYTSDDPYSIGLTPVTTITPLGLTPVDYDVVTTVTPLSPGSPVVSSILPAVGTVTTVTPISPIVVTSDIDSPYVAAVDFTYSKPYFSVYENLNVDPYIHDRMTKYYLAKTLEKWLYEDLIDVLNYIKVRDNKVDVISSLKEYNPVAVNSDSDATIKKKIDFLEKYFLNKRIIKKWLRDFIKGSASNWFDLTKSEYFLKDLFKKKLTKLLKEAVVEKR
jgi:hypothetical protein